MIDWFKAATWGVPHWAFLAALVFVIVERLLAKSKRPEFRSLMGTVAMGMRWLLLTTKLGLIPVVGTTVVRILELAAGIDIDGDGKIGEPTPDTGSVASKVPVIFLAIWSLATSSCAWLQQRGHDLLECGLEAAAASDYLGTVRRILANPSSYIVELTSLSAQIGATTVDCLVARILAGDSGTLGANPEDATIKANAEKWLSLSRAGGARTGGDTAP